MQPGCIGDHVADLLLGVEATVRMLLATDRIDAAVTGWQAAAAHLGQLRVALDLHAPALVVGQVPVEGVELVRGHRVEHALDLVQALEMPRRVEHEAAPAETRRVLDLHHRQHAVAAAGGELGEGGCAIEQAGLVAGLDHHALRGAVQRVAFAAVAEGGHDLETDAAGLACCLALGQGQARATTAGQQVGELRGDPLRGLAFGVQHGIGTDSDAAALATLYVGRRGNQHQVAGAQLRAGCFCGGRGIGGECRHRRQQGEQAAQQHCAAHPGAGRLDHRDDSLERCDERYT